MSRARMPGDGSGPNGHSQRWRRRRSSWVAPARGVVDTGRYDIDAKIPGYQARGDAEIWRLHPFARTLTMWRHQPDGTYTETMVRGGTVRLHALPDVVIDVDQLFVG